MFDEVKTGVTKFQVKRSDAQKGKKRKFDGSVKDGEGASKADHGLNNQ